MSTTSLLFGYFVGGLASSALVIARTSARTLSTWGSAALALLFWPLWLPFAFTSSGPEPVRAGRRPIEQRIAAAVTRARGAVSGTELETILSEKDGDAMLREVDRIARRLDAIEGELASNGAGTARSRERLVELARADARALEDVSELAELLATELTLARHGRAEGVEPLVFELSARVEALASS
jgi:hypothetical protein